MSSTDPQPETDGLAGPPAAEQATATADQTDDVAPSPPVTGHLGIDAALADLADVHAAPPAEQLDQLGSVQELLARVLQTSRDETQQPIPGLSRPTK